MSENIYIQCLSCQESVPDIGKFCPHCAAYLASHNPNIDDAEFNEQAEFYIYQAAEDIIEQGGRITQNNIGRMVVTGAAASAIIGITAATITAGIVAGAGLGAFRHLRDKLSDN